MCISSVQFSSVAQSCPTLCDPRPPCPLPDGRIGNRAAAQKTETVNYLLKAVYVEKHLTLNRTNRVRS